MPKLPGINHEAAIRAFGKVGFVIVRQSGHVIMRRDDCLLVIPRQNPIKAFTMGGLVKAAGLTVEEFLNLL